MFGDMNQCLRQDEGKHSGPKQSRVTMSPCCYYGGDQRYRLRVMATDIPCCLQGYSHCPFTNVRNLGRKELAGESRGQHFSEDGTEYSSH